MVSIKSALFRLSAAIVLFGAFFAHAQTVTTFEGIDASQLPQPELNIDFNGAIGTKQYMEWVNVAFQAWSKTSPFTAVWSSPQVGTSPFTTNGLSQCSSIEGDGIINFDRLASRWIIAAHNQLTSTITAYYYCVAISSTDDLTSSSLKWYTYAFPLDSILGTNSEGTLYFPDWPKIGTWSDAYYVGMDYQDINNGFQIDGIIACALDRANMLIGASARTAQCFKYPKTINGVYLGHSPIPADVDGTTTPPSGAPEYFISIENPVIDGSTTTSDALNLFQFHVNWSNPADSTFTQSTISAPVYTPGCYDVTNPPNTVCVPEPTSASSGNQIDSVGDRLMSSFAYRNFGSYESYLVSHDVQVGTGALSQTGIRWYELRGSGVPAIHQSGTISPDNSLYRFIPSIAQDQNANAAAGYSTSSSSAHPSIAASYWNLQNETAPKEISLYAGKADEENSYHWGTYSSMTVDPIGGCAFWYVNEYFSANQTGSGKPIWRTRIANFSLPSCGIVTVSPSSLSFGNQAEGTVSAKKNVTLTNGQSTALTINNITGGGSDPGDFAQTNTCGSTVTAGTACTISVDFSPTTTGTRTATLNVNDTAANSPQLISLSGNGEVPVYVNPAKLAFGNVTVGTTSSPMTASITNNLKTTLTISKIALGGTNPGDFKQTATTCGATLAAGKACTLTYTFTPAQTGARNATVTITDSASTSPQTLKLGGMGTN